MSFPRCSGTLFIAVAAALSVSACKPRTGDETSLKDATAVLCSETVDYVEVPGVGYIGGMYANQNQGKLEMKKLDKTTWDVCSAAGNASEHGLGYGAAGGLTIDVAGVKFQMPKNPAANWGYLNTSIKCGTVGKLLGLTFDSTQSDKNCEVQFDTEDQSWYAATIRPEWLQSVTGFDETADAANIAFLDAVMKKQVADGKGSTMDKPLAPRQINSNLDDRVLGVMEILHKKYQANSGTSLVEANRERNTCLRNGRAHSWLDIQAHFYCILPYYTRQCYSTGLVTMTQGINAVTDPQQKLGILLTAMNKSYAQCFDPGKQYDWKNDFPNDADQIGAAFKYVMFVRQGVMDFNIASSNALIEKFYANVKDSGTPARPGRLLDPQPWSAKQQRYAEIRQGHASAIRLSIAKGQCAAGGGTWNDASNQCDCPANETWNGAAGKCEGKPAPTWQTFLDSDNFGTVESSKGWSAFDASTDIPVLMKDTLVYNKTNASKFADGKKLYVLPAKSLLKVMKEAESKYDSAGVNLSARNACLNTGYTTSHWSDIQIHYYCQHYNPRQCYSSTASSSRNRLLTYDKCVDNAAYDPPGATDVKDFLGFRWISKDKERANMFQYIMDSNTYAFDMDQQQMIINAFYGVPNPGDFAYLATPEGRVKCAEFRPTRKDEKVIQLRGSDALKFANTKNGMNYGRHCIPSKLWKTKLKGRGY